MNWLFFINNMTLITLVITMVVLTVAVAAETFWPRRELQMPLTWRWGNNLVLALITWYSAHLVSYVVMMDFALWTQEHQFGLFHQFEVGLVIQLAVLLVISQLMSYLTHIAFHKVPWLWRCHMVHHSDTSLDFSSSYRHHPIEVVLTYLAAIPVLALLGPPVAVMVVYQAIRVVKVIWDHANVYIPEPIDRFLRLFLITPDFHRLHHCSEQRFTDSNFGAISPWFDYLFKTASDRPFEEQRTMEMGLENYRTVKDSRVDQLLLMPFRRQADPANSGSELLESHSSPLRNTS